MKSIHPIVRLLCFSLCVLLAISCRKETTNDPPTANLAKLQTLLKDSLSAADYASVDFATFRTNPLPKTNDQVTRIGFTGKNILHDFIVLRQDSRGELTAARIVHVDGGIEQTATARPSFNGHIETSSLKREIKTVSVITNGFVMSLHTSSIRSNAVGMNYADCSDCTIPEVVVSASYSDSGISWDAWMSFLSLFGGGGGNNAYMLIDYGGGGGGSGSPGNGDVINIDHDYPENKDAIDAKKYMDCFGSIPDAGANFIITIATDIPVDGDPSKFFNWNIGSPGHTYIELYKAGSNGGLISQNIGFYPNSSWKAARSGNTSSKIGDDAGHEYNARYTISVSASQFQAAINAVQTYSSHDYNIATYNCTDFALSVFNAAGGNLTIPKYTIPGYLNGGAGSNTPQGLYNKISDMAAAGNGSAATNGNKAYGGTSHGPCN